jgi:hypothetical protein
MDGWMDGWMGGWMGGKAGLRIAYSNQKYFLFYMILSSLANPDKFVRFSNGLVF